MAKIDKKLDNFIDEKIKSQRLEEIMSERFGRYSKYIIQDRALPDARDGLKPVQRRILYAMDQMGLAHNKSYKKSARIAGEVMGKYHPHGDSSIYDAMVRLSQDFKMRVPLIDMHGNNGSIDGDSAAAMRYTEARLSKEAEYLLADIDKRTVNFVPNFDDEEIEPTVLPAKFPNLLVNGAMGISAGYATKIPPHNLREIITATLALIDNPKLTVDEIANIIKGPDFPTGGIVQGKEGILQALATGVGKVIIRATSQIEEISKSQDRIVITQIPYEVVKSDLIRDIDNLRISNNVEDILEVRDETDQEGLRIAIDLKKGANTEVILNYLFKNTNLQVSYNYNMVSIMNSRPVLSGVIPLLLFYIEHQKEVITNRSNFELERAMKRQHIVAGLIKMVSIVDEVISIIRGSKNKADSKQNLMDKFDFSDLQAEAIVMLQLYRLSTTDIQALISENEQLSSQINNLNEILSNEKVLLKLIKKELANTLEVLGTDRKSVIEEEIASIKIDETQLISDERVVVAVTKDGYIKRSSVRSFSASKEVGLKENDAILFESEVSTLDTLIIFLSKGNYAYLPIHKIDEQKWRDLGIYLNNLVTINRDEKIVYATVVNTFNTAAQILLASKLGMMKQIKLSDLEVSRYNKAIRVMKLDNDDELVAVDFNTKEYIVALSKNGYGLRFKSQELPLYGLSAGGVKGMALNQGDNLASAFFATGADEIYILTSRAHVIKDVVAEIPLYARYRKGIMIIDKQKTNPHYIRSACRFTKAQAKDDCLARLVTTKTYKILAASELKANGNKFGKKMFADNEGEGLFLAISPSLNEKEETVVPPKTSEVVKEKPTKLVEEAIIKGNTQIRLSRLDLFDDED